MNLPESLAKIRDEKVKARQHHDEDCADQNETFGPDESCECGASLARQALKKGAT